MKHRKQFRRIVIAAAAGLASLTLAASSVMAQYQIGQQGRALDANNRIGGGGFNTPVFQQVNPQGNYNNNLITGNVTGGKGFQGFVPYASPEAFRGPTAGSISDQFIRGSSGAPYGGIPQNNAQVNQSFFGVSQAAPPPPGYVQQGTNGGFVPAAFKSASPNDGRLDASIDASVPTANLPRPGQLLLPGPVDSNTQAPTVITASPLYGWRQWNPNAASDQASLDNVSGNRAALNNIDPATMERMRNELTQPVSPTDADQQQLLQQQNDAKKAGAMDTAVPTPFDSPQNQALSGSSVIKSNQPLTSSALVANNSLQTGASVGMRLQSPQQQSTLYADLQKRLQQNQMAQANTQTGVGAQGRNQQLKTNTAPTTPGALPGAQPPVGVVPPPAGAAANPAQPAMPGVPSMPPMVKWTTPDAKTEVPAPPANVLPAETAVQRPEPLPIHSLAEGVQAKGLKDLLTEAETQMKAGKYNSALEEYDLAEELAPNNPLILLGRANAELGQSYYSRAELHLRQAFTQDQALLMGKVDLISWLGNDRLRAIVEDLRGIADREQKEARPVFLLAYISYCTGNERMAAAYLDLADKRSGGKDELYSLIRKDWQLPAATDQNK